MQEKLVKILNEMAEYLSIAQMKKLQEVLLENLDESHEEKTEISNTEYLQLYLDAKKIEGCSERTLQYYRVTIEKLLLRVISPIRKITTEEIRSYLSEYQKINNCSKVTVDNIRRNISSFFSWLEEEDYILKSPMRRIHKIKTKQPVKEIISDEAIERLGNICKRVKRYPTFCNMEYLESGVRVIRIGNILQDGHMDVEDKNYVFVYEKANDDFPETIIERNDIVMAVRGDGSAASRIGIITEEKLIGANISPNLIRMQADSEKILPLFFFYYLTGEVGQKRLDSYVNKTAKKNIAAKDIVKVMTPIPPLDIQRQFVSLVEQVNKSKVVVASVK